MTVVEARASPSNLLLKNDVKEAPTLLGGRKEKNSSSKEIAGYYSNCAKETKKAEDEKMSQRMSNAPLLVDIEGDKGKQKQTQKSQKRVS